MGGINSIKAEDSAVVACTPFSTNLVGRYRRTLRSRHKKRRRANIKHKDARSDYVSTTMCVKTWVALWTPRTRAGNVPLVPNFILAAPLMGYCSKAHEPGEA